MITALIPYLAALGAILAISRMIRDCQAAAPHIRALMAQLEVI